MHPLQEPVNDAIEIKYRNNRAGLVEALAGAYGAFYILEKAPKDTWQYCVSATMPKLPFNAQEGFRMTLVMLGLEHLIRNPPEPPVVSLADLLPDLLAEIKTKMEIREHGAPKHEPPAQAL
jgi:hypothetical protein